MRELTRQVLLGLLTVVVAAVVLLPLFIALKLLLDMGLEFVAGAVVIFGLLLAYVLRRETVR